jgi:nitroimidazol reductase NimA-like FMN-containing flavoprotein (pyridoxamine 5'-phosphate oxidase superfamily)
VWDFNGMPYASLGERVMRRRNRELKNMETILAILERTAVGRMATINRKGFPAIKPINFLYWDSKIYLHSSTKGEKISDIRRGSPVCFEVDEPVGYVASVGPACRSTYYYRSVIVKGNAVIVSQVDRKLEIFERLMQKYQPEGGYKGVTKEILKRTAVIEISVREITGKEYLG